MRVKLFLRGWETGCVLGCANATSNRVNSTVVGVGLHRSRHHSTKGGLRHAASMKPTHFLLGGIVKKLKVPVESIDWDHGATGQRSPTCLFPKSPHGEGFTATGGMSAPPAVRLTASVHHGLEHDNLGELHVRSVWLSTRKGTFGQRRKSGTE